MGRILALSPHVGYIPEPFGSHHRLGHCAVPFPLWFPYVTRENEAPYIDPVSDMLAFRYRTDLEIKSIRSCRDAGRLVRDNLYFARHKKAGARPLMKDPLAFFSTEWLASRFNLQPVILIRHPAAFVSSLKQLGWTHPFDHFLRQPLLIRDLLEPYRSRIQEFATTNQPIVEQAILLWQLIHHTILQYRSAHPGWILMRHEDISRQPVQRFNDLFCRLSLPFGSAIEQRIREYSAETNPIETENPLNIRRSSNENIWKWRRALSDEEIQHIRRAVEPISQEFYGDSDWAASRQPEAECIPARPSLSFQAPC